MMIAIGLNGPLRTEFQAVVYVSKLYNSFIDTSVDATFSGVESGALIFKQKHVFIPFTILALTSIPVAVICCTVGLPVFFPLILIGIVGSVMLASVAGVVAVSSKKSREKIQTVINPLWKKLTCTAVGQQILYQTGPRPNLQKIVKTFTPKAKHQKLIASIIIDAIGSSSYALPFLGEATDIAWAPISAIIVGAMYSESSPYIYYINLLEEVLPFTDILPSATLAWLRENGADAVKDVHKILTSSGVSMTPSGELNIDVSKAQNLANSLNLNFKKD